MADNNRGQPEQDIYRIQQEQIKSQQEQIKNTQKDAGYFRSLAVWLPLSVLVIMVGLVWFLERSNHQTLACPAPECPQAICPAPICPRADCGTYVPPSTSLPNKVIRVIPYGNCSNVELINGDGSLRTMLVCPK